MYKQFKRQYLTGSTSNQNANNGAVHAQPFYVTAHIAALTSTPDTDSCL